MRLRGVVPSFLLAVLVSAAFAGVADNGFVPFDDDRYITGNPAVRAGLAVGSIRWAFTAVGAASNWHPLTWLSHMADVQLFGLDPRWHHLMSLLLYSGGCLLLYGALQAATGARWRSFFAVALFAVHPLRVESVAWASERKDMLAFLCAMATLAAWLSWLRRPGFSWRYALAAGAYVAGLLAKQTLLTLPFALLLVNRWPLGRGWGNPAPGGWSRSRITVADRGALFLFVPAALAACMALAAQAKGGGLLDQAAPPLALRIANAVVSATAYLGLEFFPRGLAVFYPFPGSIPLASALGAAALLAGVTLAAWSFRRRHPALLAGWIWYAVTLLPAAGLVAVGGQSMADRYVSLPSVGVAVALVWTVSELVGRRGVPRLLAVVAGGATALALVPISRAQVGVWRDGSTLFSHALAVTRENWLIEHELGVLLLNAKRYPEAELHLREAVRLQPRYVLGRFNLAGTLFWQGRTDGAVREYRETIGLRPDFAEAHFRLARALAFAGRWEEAFGEYGETLRLDPDHAGAAAGRRKASAARSAASTAAPSGGRSSYAAPETGVGTR